MPVLCIPEISRNFSSICTCTDDKKLDFEDKITKSSCVTYNGEIVNDYVSKAIRKGAET